MTHEGATLLVATRSEGKLREMLPMLAARGCRGITLEAAGIPFEASEEAVEAFETFEENALAKARWFFARQAESHRLAVLADDSGLCVDALGGAPGVRSKRWSGAQSTGPALDRANNAALLAALAAQGQDTNRRARYVAVATIVTATGTFVARGETGGEILRSPRGSHGFGYDPLFLSDELAKTFAEASLEEKAAVGHRGRALRAVLEQRAASRL